MKISKKPQEQIIQYLCYDLYKADWMRRISAESIMDTLKDYYDDCVEIGVNPYTGEADVRFNISQTNFIEEIGFNGGQIYSCIEEFLDVEFRNKLYIKSLLGDMKTGTTSVYDEYLKMIN